MTRKEESHTLAEITTIVRYIMDNMMTKDEGATKEDLKGFATKEDLKRFATKEDLMKMSHELRDHTTRECAKVRGDLVALARRQDEKTNEFIRVTERSSAISRSESIRLQTINPFLRPDQP